MHEEELLGAPSAPLHELVDRAPRGVHERRGGAVDHVPRCEQVGAAGREAGPVEDPEDRPEDVVASHVRRSIERVEDDGEAPAAHVLHLAHLLGGHVGDELGLPHRIDEEVVHPDVELELPLPVHVPRRGGVPAHGKLAPDPGREAREGRKQSGQVDVDFRRVVREQDVRPVSPLSTSRTIPRSGPGASPSRHRSPTRAARMCGRCRRGPGSSSRPGSGRTPSAARAPSP